jgi:hypothetical protein
MNITSAVLQGLFRGCSAIRGPRPRCPRLVLAPCHIQTLQTASSSWASALANQTIHPYSDIALHHMGPGFADQITHGLAAGDESRSEPLWGSGQRLYILHDGRTADLMDVIAAHASPGNSPLPASEANGIVHNFNALSTSDQQAVLDFRRYLYGPTRCPRGVSSRHFPLDNLGKGGTYLP